METDRGANAVGSHTESRPVIWMVWSSGMPRSSRSPPLRVPLASP
jgi:hypothetical protein